MPAGVGSAAARSQQGHPSGIYVAEAALLDGVTGFLATAVYGPQRASYWERGLAATDAP